MRSHAIRRRKSRQVTITVPRIERRYQAVDRRISLHRHRDASRLAARVRSRTLTTPVVEMPSLPLLSSTPVLSHVDVLSRRHPRTQVLSGQALAKAPVKPTVNLKALYYTRPDVMVCVRRKQRREVLFALGKGGGAHRKPKFTEESKYICY